MNKPDAKRPMDLKLKNERLKKLLAEHQLENGMIRSTLRK